MVDHVNVGFAGVNLLQTFNRDRDANGSNDHARPQAREPVLDFS